VFDVLVVGGGPAGRAVAAACGEQGLRTTVLDPAPGRPWRATYGAWRDELPTGLPSSVIAATARGRAVARTEHALDREYAVLDTAGLRRWLDERLAAAGVAVRRGRVQASSPPSAAVVIDAAGAGQPLSTRRRSRVAAEQTAVGLVVPAGLAEPLLRPGEALFMDWRPVPGADASRASFLYAVPLGGDRVLLEETSLARRPGSSFDELSQRLAARLSAHRIRPPADASRELVRFPLDVPPHRARGVLGFGAAAPFTHPATGYQLATALKLAEPVAEALAAGLTGGPARARRAARAVLWPPAARAVHLLRRRGLECLLRLPPDQLPAFFEGFFRLPARHRHSYLSGRADPVGTSAAMLGLFDTLDWPLRLRLIGSSLLVSARPEVIDPTSVQYRAG
jgi:lycopene beta-cyclase